MNTRKYLRLGLTTALISLGSTACGGSQATPVVVRPSPTIAVAPTTAVATSQPTATSTPPPPSPTTASTLAPTGVALGETAPAAPAQPQFAYLWPAYLPDGMRISPGESRVAQENEIGTNGAGFYLVTLNGEARKLVVGGGATDALPLTGEQREITVDGQTVMLTTNGNRRLLVFPNRTGKIFLYSSGLEEDELILIAESLVPIDVASLRQQVSEAGA